MKLGAQLYTVHEHTQTLEGIEKTFEKVAKIGYTTVQVSGTCAYKPEWLRDTLKKYGLTCAITHTDPVRMQQSTADVVAEHKTFGCKYLGIGGMPGDCRGSFENLKLFGEKYLPVAEKIASLGCKLFYHNHSFEFVKYDGKAALRHIADMFPKDTLGFTLDTYWVQAGGGDVIQWINSLAGRLECVHLKDMIGGHDNVSKMAPIYEGNMNFDGIIKACKDAGTEYVLVEQDYCYDTDPFDCLKQSFDNIIGRYPELR